MRVSPPLVPETRRAVFTIVFADPGEGDAA